MSLTAGQLAPGLLRLYWWRCNAWGCVGGSVFGAVAALVIFFFFRDLSEKWQFGIATSLSFLGTIGASLLTAPTPMPVLQNFYRTTRPFGWWKPLHDQVQGAERAAMDRENRNDMISVPFALVWQVTLFLLPMQLVIKAYSAFWCTLPIFLTGMAGMYWFWWRPLMRAQPVPAPAPVG